MQNQTLQNEKLQTPPDLVDEDADQATEIAHQLGCADLKRARENKRMSVGDAAYSLKVSPRVIEAIETGDWSALPGRTFAVGILRAYGRLLETPVDALVDTIPGAGAPVVRKTAATRTPARKAAPSGRRDGEAKRQTNRMLRSGLVMVLVAVLLAYAVPGEFWNTSLQNAQSLVDRVLGNETGAVTQPQNELAVPATDSDQSKMTTVSQVEQVQTGTGTLELRFAAPAWVEVRDYTGRIIYSQLNAAGSTQFITGVAPLDVMIGNAKQVQARWRDEPIKLDKLSADDVARQVLR